MTDVISVCDPCFDLPMDEDAFDLIFEKAGVDGPVRGRTAKAQMEKLRNAHVEHLFSIEKVFPEDD